MKSNKAQGSWFWMILALILLIISIILIVGYYTGIFPKFSEVVQANFFGPIE